MTAFLVYVVVGGLIGWLASIVMHTNGQQGIILNVVVGIIGAFLAGLVLTPIFGISTIGQGNYSVGAILVTLSGAIILLAVVNLFRRGAVR
ncbi:GlsB/YeaQ/YmgE family stress response membrane protein [candidate division KSB1 bacterium]|nr:GlsB/YeaQ/YmgE family stress response membrane protein [candidate division KSB1 bacterium]